MAREVFKDPLAVLELDDSPGEERITIMGVVGARLLLVVYAERGNGIVRIISARKATMKSASTKKAKLRKTPKHDWRRFDAMTDEEVLAAARTDPDAQPLTDEQLKRMRRIPFAKHLRWKLGLSQQEFAERFQIPIGTLRDWEQGRVEPDRPAQAYLKAIAGNPDAVRKALKSAA